MGRRQLGDPVAIPVPTDHPAQPAGQVDFGGGAIGRADHRRARRGERGIPGQDARLELAQLRPRLEADLLEQDLADVLVGGQGPVGASAALVGEHPQGPEVLAQRVVGDGGQELQEGPFRVTEGQQRLHLPLAHLGTQLVEPDDGRTDPGLVGERGERAAAPHGQRFFRASQGTGVLPVGQQAERLVRQHREPRRVDVLGDRDQPVAVRLPQQDGGGLAARPSRLQEVAQPPDVRIQSGR